MLTADTLDPATKAAQETCGNTSINPGPDPCEGGAMGKDTRPRDHRGHFRKAAIPQAVRREVAIRAGGIPGKTMPATCTYCGAPGGIYWPNRQPGIPGAWVAFTNLELDHVTPEYKGGPNTADNIVLACRPCNRRKGHR